MLCTGLVCRGCPGAGAVGGAAPQEEAVRGLSMWGALVLALGLLLLKQSSQSLGQSPVRAVPSCLPDLRCLLRGQLRMGGFGCSSWHSEGSVFFLRNICYRISQDIFAQLSLVVVEEHCPILNALTKLL